MALSAATRAVAKEKKLSVEGSSCKLAETAIAFVVAVGSLIACAIEAISGDRDGLRRDSMADIMSEI